VKRLSTPPVGDEPERTSDVEPVLVRVDAAAVDFDKLAVDHEDYSGLPNRSTRDNYGLLHDALGTERERLGMYMDHQIERIDRQAIAIAFELGMAA
jgi:hypothetical protein